MPGMAKATKRTATAGAGRPAKSGEPASAARSPERPRDKASSAVIMAVILVLIVSATVRLYQLQRPATVVFDETYYAKDANTILHGYLGSNPGYPWEPGKEVSWPHPEYGKWAIATGVAVFGNRSIGWRIAPAIAGTILLALVYPIGRRVGLSPPWALLALVLAASDFLGIVQSRIATLDVFVALWTALCTYLALRYVQTGHRTAWLVLCGLAGGIALGTKWSGLYALLAAAAILLLFRRRPWREPGGKAVAHALRDLVLPVVALVVLPAALYLLSYTLYFAKGHHTWSQWVELQHQMWWFNTRLHATHPYASKPWTWIFDYRPVSYYYVYDTAGVHDIISMGNPLLWWASIPSLVGLVVVGIYRRSRLLLVVPVVVALLYLPWLSTSRTSFMYYLTPVAPFLATAVALAFRELARGRLPESRYAASCFIGATAITAVFWYQIGEAARWLFWTLPGQGSTDLARVVVVVAAAAAAGLVVGLALSERTRTWWPYIAWLFAGAVAGICIAFLPILIDLTITRDHFYHLMWFRNWI